MAGICNDVRKSWHSEAPENGSGEVLPALSLRSAELGKHKAFLANRSGARPEGLWNAWIFHIVAAARHTRRPPAPGGFRPPNPMNLLAFAADL